MQSPNNAHEEAEDHDYHLPRTEESQSSDVFVVRENRPRIYRILDNTDHDYLATEEADSYSNDAEEAEQESAASDNEPVQPAAVEEEPVRNEEETRDASEPDATTSAAANADPNSNVVNLTSPSPPKKRKRLSTRAPKSNTPSVKTSKDSDGDEEDDGLTCPICLDCWEMSGEHRLVSIKCGHLFGESCLRRWLLESCRQTGVKACPQCKTKVLPRDIRCLYARRVRALDRSEEHRLRVELEQERERTSSLKSELAGLKISYAMVTNKINTLEADNERMKQMLRAGGGGYSYDSDVKQVCLQRYKLFLEKNIEICKEAGCRVLISAEKQCSIIVSQKSSQSLFPGYGLRFIDTPSFRPSTFLHASSKLVRDISLNADQNLLAVTSMETRSKLFDLRTRQVAAMFTPSDKALWACALDRNERENFLYLGAQHGSTYIYDVRFPETVVDEFKAEGDFSPVINIASVPISKHFPCGGFLVCKLQSLWFFEYSTVMGNAVPHRLAIEGPFCSMNFDAGHETLLVSARSNQSYPQSRYVLGKLEKIDDVPVFNVKVSFFGSKTTPVMTRCSQIAVEANTLIAGYIQDVRLLALFDARREQRLQSMPVQEVVYDTCPVYMSNATYLAALTDTKCRIYRLTPTS